MAALNGEACVETCFGVKIQHSLSRKGKGLFATQDYAEGEVIFVEQPLVSAQFAWNAEYRYLACDYCMRSLETAEYMARRLTGNTSLTLPHSECCSVRPSEHVLCHYCSVSYCSEVCRESAWNSYHKTLCMQSATASESHPLYRLIEAWKNMHYPPETCSIVLIARIFAIVSQGCERQTFLKSLAQFCRSTVNEEQCIVHKLLGDKFQGQLDVLRTMLSEMFSGVDELQQWLTPEGFQSLFALIGTNGQGIGTSSLSVWAKRCEALCLPDDERQQLNAFIDKLYSDMDDVSGEFLDCESSGLYLLQSSCNHSCCPNAEVTFPDNNFVLTVKAFSEIKCGEEIVICYLGECDRERSRHSRQKILSENYLFHCTCDKCHLEADQPDTTSEEEEEDNDDDCMEFVE